MTAKSWAMGAILLTSFVLAEMFSLNIKANCKLDGIWEDTKSSDVIEATYNTDKSEIEVVYYADTFRYHGSGIYDGSENSGARITLRIDQRVKPVVAWMTCRDDKLLYEGRHRTTLGNGRKASSVFLKVPELSPAALQSILMEPCDCSCQNKKEESTERNIDVSNLSAPMFTENAASNVHLHPAQNFFVNFTTKGMDTHCKCSISMKPESSP